MLRIVATLTALACLVSSSSGIDYFRSGQSHMVSIGETNYVIVSSNLFNDKWMIAQRNGNNFVFLNKQFENHRKTITDLSSEEQSLLSRANAAFRRVDSKSAADDNVVNRHFLDFQGYLPLGVEFYMDKSTFNSYYMNIKNISEGVFTASLSYYVPNIDGVFVINNMIIFVAKNKLVSMHPNYKIGLRTTDLADLLRQDVQQMKDLYRSYTEKIDRLQHRANELASKGKTVAIERQSLVEEAKLVTQRRDLHIEHQGLTFTRHLMPWTAKEWGFDGEQ